MTVSGQSPLIDVTNVAKQQTISSEQLDAVPTSKGQLAYISLVASAIAPPGAQDVGGSKGETSIRMSIHGAKQNDSKGLQDGMSYNWINVPTGRSFFTNPLGAQEIVVETGSGAEYSSGGAQVNQVMKDGGNRYSGTIFLGGTSHVLQGDNLTSDLEAAGLRTVNGIRSIYDANAVLGGPLIANTLWFVTAHRRWGRNERIANLFHDSNLSDWQFTPDFSHPVDAAEDSRSDNIRLTWQATPKDKFTGSYDWQHNNALNQAGGLNSGTLAAEAVGNPDAYCNRVGLYQGTWTHPASDHLLLEGGVTLMTQARSFGFDYSCGGDPYAIAVREQSTNFNYHGVGIQRNDKQYPLVERFSLSYLTSAHHIKVGLNSMESVQSHTYTGNGMPTLPVSYVFNNGAPVSLTEYASPISSDAQVRPALGIFVQDQWRLRRVTLNLGLRYEYLRAFAGAEDLPAGALVGARSFPQVDCVPCWHDLNPRLAAAYDLFGDGKTAVKASRLPCGGRQRPAGRHLLTGEWLSPSRHDRDGWKSELLPDCDLRNPAPMANADRWRVPAGQTPR